LTLTLTKADALIVVDLQIDFLPGGSLAVAGGNDIIARIEALAARFDNVILTQDWHTPGHISFASSHQGKAPFETIELDYGTQVLWPDHCVMGTFGAAIVSEPLLSKAQMIIRKGYNHQIDSYSGFQEADRRTRTGLAGYLVERGFERLFVVGLATDFCVSWTALDARAAGFETYVIEALTRPIDNAGSLENAHKSWDVTGVKILGLNDLQ
jgi:nicotinamidase/pyrazinamidase